MLRARRDGSAAERQDVTRTRGPMQTLEGLLLRKPPPPNRVSSTDGESELHFTEAAVMLAYAFHLFRTYSALVEIELHPDGEHGKRFDIPSWLASQGFALVLREGRTDYGGLYSDGRRGIRVTPKSGLGDVVATTPGGLIVAECKGGIVNTRHPGQKSRLRRGLYEAVGLLMSRPITQEHQYAVVPHTGDTATVAEKLISRCQQAGIGIHLVASDGSVHEISA